MWKYYTFGYDVSNVENVMAYVIENYHNDDYRMIIDRDDDTMNALEIIVDENGDDELEELIAGCEGKGNYEE